MEYSSWLIQKRFVYLHSIQPDYILHNNNRLRFIYAKSTFVHLRIWAMYTVFVRRRGKKWNFHLGNLQFFFVLSFVIKANIWDLGIAKKFHSISD